MSGFQGLWWKDLEDGGWERIMDAESHLGPGARWGQMTWKPRSATSD